MDRQKNAKAIVVLLAFAFVPLTGLAANSSSGRPPSPAVPSQAFVVALSGAQEVPEVDTPTVGRAAMAFDPGCTSLEFLLKLQDAPDVRGVHLHCGRAGENGPVALGIIGTGPCRLDGDTIRCKLTNADVSPLTGCGPDGGLINNLASLAAAMREGSIYLNVHTVDNPGGEVRGQPQSHGGPDSIAGVVCDVCKILDCKCDDSECYGCP